MPARRIILVVDDDHDVRVALVDMLEMWGFEAVGAGDAEAAERILQEGLEPSLVVLDLSMRRKSERGLLQLLRSSERWRTTPVLAVSASKVTLPKEANAFLLKPFNIAALERTVRALCP